MHAEVPHIQIEFVAGEHFDQSIFAELEWRDRSEFEPLAAGQWFGFHFDHIGLRADTELRDAEAIDDAFVIADIDALDDVTVAG